MSSTQQPVVRLDQFLRILADYPKRWLIPAVAVAVGVGLFGLVRPDTWEASQALIVRNEATNNQDGPGKFSHTEEMQTVQETILELARSHGVLAASLAEVGPSAGAERRADWPSARDVDQLREAVKLVPPKGAEFGKTEIFYLKVRSRDRDRAIALAGAVCDQLQARFQKLRDAKAKSMIGELVKTINITRTDLAESTDRLARLEKQVGSDLAELRILHDASSGDSSYHRTIAEIRNELRQAKAAKQTNKDLLDVLKDAQDDSGRLVATPNRLLQSQPALRRLKDGLLDAQLATARLKGKMSDDHPLVRAAREAEQEISRDLHNELAIAIRGVKVDLRLNAERVAMLNKQFAATTGRLDELAGLRAVYSNQVAETRHRTELLKRAEQNLADARASQASANAASLIARIDQPDAGTRPVGPSLSMIGLVGIAGGLLTGFGVLLMTVPLVPSTVASVPISGQSITGDPGATICPGAARSNGEQTTEPALQPNGTLSFKQALQKLSVNHPEWN